MLSIVLKDLAEGTLESRLPSHVLGVAIAGSYAKNDQTPDSDLDLFVIFELGDTTVYRVRIEELLSILPPPLIRRGPVPVPHFGDSVTLMYADTSIVQVNFNTFESLEINPMRSASRIVFDRDGEYQRLVEASLDCSLDQRSIFREYADWFLIRAGYAARSLRKGELLRAAGYLHETRIALMQLLRLAAGKFFERRNPFLPSTRFEAELGPAAASLVGELFPSYSVEGIRQALMESLRLFESLLAESASDYEYDRTAACLVLPTLFDWTRSS